MDDGQVVGEDGVRVLGEVLGLDGWVWEHPELPAVTVNGLWPLAPNDCWAVGDHGLLAHWDGRHWTGGLPWFDRKLCAVWGARSGELWFGGARLVHLRDGHWSVDPIELPAGERVLSLSGCAADDVWAVGNSFTLHFDGTRWQRIADRGGQAVWARAPGEAWAAWGSFREHDGDLRYIRGQPGGGVRRFDGRNWQEWDFGRPVAALHGIGSGDLWAAGPHGLVRHFDGRQWRDDAPADSHNWMGVCVTAPGDVWLVGARRDDRRPVPLVFRRRSGAWAAQPGSERLSANLLKVVRASAPSDVWLAGWSEVYRSDGQELWPVGRRSLPAFDSLLAIGGTAPDDLWAAGRASLILHRDRRGWHPVRTDWPGVIWALAARGPDEAWATGSDGLVGRWDGRSWRRIEAPTKGNLKGIVIDGAGAAWIAGEGSLLRHDNAGWRQYPLPDARGRPIALAIDGAGTGFALVPLWPRGGRLLRLASGGPEPVGPDLPVRPSALWSGAPGIFWIFHDDGVLSGDGQTWKEGLPGVSRIHQVIGSGPDDLWMMGHDQILQWNGRSLIHRPRPFLQLNQMWRGPGSLFAVGENGAVLRLDE